MRLLFGVRFWLLAHLAFVTVACLLGSTALVLVYRLLGATVANNERVVVTQQLVVVYCCVGHAHVGPAWMAVAARQLLMLISNGCRRSVDHVVLRLMA